MWLGKVVEPIIIVGSEDTSIHQIVSRIAEKEIRGQREWTLITRLACFVE